MTERVQLVRLGHLAGIQYGYHRSCQRSTAIGRVTLPYLRVANRSRRIIGPRDVTRKFGDTKATARSSTLRAWRRTDDRRRRSGQARAGHVWNDEITNCLHQNHVFAVRPDQRTTPPRYLTLVTRQSTHALTSDAQERRLPNLHCTSGSKIGISESTATLDEQRRIADFLDAETARIDSAIALITRQGQVLDQRVSGDYRCRYSGETEKQIPLKYIASIVDTEHKTAPTVPGGGYRSRALFFRAPWPHRSSRP